MEEREKARSMDGVIDIVCISGGKIVEHSGIPDNLRVIQQLGSIRAPV